MSYTDIDVTRAEQTDAGNGTDAIGGRTIGGKAWQGTVGPETLGTWGYSAGGLVESNLINSGARSVYEVRCNLDAAASADYWFVLVDTASGNPAGLDVIDAVRVVPGGTSTLSYPGGYPLSAGVHVAISTTLATVTLPGDSSALFSWNVE